MKIFWKLLNKLIFSVLFCTILFVHPSLSEIKDIWQQSKIIKETESNKNLENQIQNELPPTTINQIPKAELQISNISQSAIEESSREVIFGIYDPGTTNIPVNFWNSIPADDFSNFQKAMLEGNNTIVTNQLISKIFFSKTNLSNFDDKGLAYLNFYILISSMFKNKPVWTILLIFSLIVGVMIFVNSLDISPSSKPVEKKLPNENILEVVK